MKTSLAALGCVALSAFSAVAQDIPVQETFLGYTYTRFNSATNVPAYSANGAGGQYAYNFSKWLSAVVDVGAVHNGNIGGFQVDNTFANFLAGPRVSFRYSRIRPYFQALFGGVHATASSLIAPGTVVTVNPLSLDPTIVSTPIENRPVSARFVTSQTSFGMAFGGGLDIKNDKHMSFRPIGLDWYMTRLQNVRSLEDNNQHNLRFTTGLNFTFGAQ